MTTSIEAFKKWLVEEEYPLASGHSFNVGWDIGRAALIEEIKAGGIAAHMWSTSYDGGQSICWEFDDKKQTWETYSLYRLPEGV